MNAAREKIEREGGCRVCGAPPAKCDAAHTWNRGQGGAKGFDDADAIVPLCSKFKGGAGHHDAYDAYELDLLPFMTTDEQVALVRYAGSIERARDRARGAGEVGAKRRPDDGPF